MVWYMPMAILLLSGWMLFNNIELWRTLIPFILVAAAGTLIPIYRSQTTSHQSVLYFSAGILSLGLVKLFPIAMHAFGNPEPTTTAIFSYLNIMPNLFFTAALITYLMVNRNRWHPFQLGLDITVSALMALGALVTLYFYSSILSGVGFGPQSIPSLLIIAIDTVAVTTLIALCVSSRSKKIEIGPQLIFLAILIFTAADAFSIGGATSIPQLSAAVIEFMYLLSILMMASGVRLTYLTIQQRDQQEPGQPRINDGPFRLGYAGWLAVPPLLSMLFSGVNLPSLMFFLVVLIFYLVLSIYIQKNITTERLLAESNLQKAMLENKVLEHKRRIKYINDDIHFNAEHDKLTGLYNRDHFLRLIDQTISRTPTSRHLYLIIVDVDRFRFINDSYGHEVGDEVLKRTAERIVSVFDDKYSYVSRLDGNEFAILYYGSKAFGPIYKKTSELFAIFARPMNVSPFQILANIRVGVASYPENAENRTDLLKCAKTATEQAKIRKLDVCSTYDDTLYQQERRKQAIEVAMRKADIQKEFTVYYQPLFSTATRHLMGMEALLRWDSPEVGLIGPTEFIPIAEETGLILELGHWVMETAMRQVGRWNKEYGTELCVSINVSAIQIQNTNFIYGVRSLVHKTKVQPRWVNFEITESSSMASLETYEKVLRELTNMGISISIDDFGTGYSSYVYLQRASIDYLKIDKDLIDMISKIAGDAQIVNAIISMAKSLEIKTVAEGVELIEQIELLEKMGCDLIQGFYYGKPTSADEFLQNHINNLHSDNIGLQVSEKPFKIGLA